MATVTADGLSLHYTVRGEGTPLIFIHPPVLSSVNFAYQLKHLSKDFKVITFDIRGHGKSHPSRQAVTYPLIAEDIKRIMDHLRLEKAFLCGYSVAGSITLEFLLKFPERSMGAILMGGISEVNDWLLKKQISLAVSLSRMGAISTLAYSISWSNADTIATFRRLVKDARRANAKNAAEYYDYALTYNCTEKLYTIPFPVLLLYGAKEKSFHHYGQLIHTKLPNSKLTFIRNVKHQLPTKAYKKVNKLITQFVFSHQTQI
jgi:pimeloyl-ACP methyl ester carboxylesterase